MEQKEIIKSKYYRLRMSPALARMIRALPWRVDHEVKSRDVYTGNGLVRIMGRTHEARITVRVTESGLEAEAASESAGLSVTGPFNTEQDADDFANAVRLSVISMMN